MSNKLNDVRNLLKTALDSFASKSNKVTNDILNNVDVIKKTTAQKLKQTSNNISSKNDKK